MRLISLLILFYFSGIRTVLSQGMFMGSYNCNYIDTTNDIIHTFLHTPLFDNYPDNAIVFPEKIHRTGKTYTISEINLLANDNKKDSYMLE